MMDVEKCGTRDMNSKQQTGKNFSRDWKLKKGNKKLKNEGKAIIIISPYFTECWVLELPAPICLKTLI